ncbi:MAG TPA: hypothetical protein VJQ52_03245 [Steroidobacteraceae bacterium]|nr:hypothetical protein [Steroidobacteraceae bacterium]
MRVALGVIALICATAAFGEAQPEPPAGTRQPVDVRLVNDKPLQVHSTDEHGVLDPNFIVALSSLLVAGFAFILSVSQGRRQYQSVQMETCERMFGDLRRTELEFKTPIDAHYAKAPAAWDPPALRKGNTAWDHAAWDYFARWDHLAFLVLEKRVDDKAMLVLVERKARYAMEQMKQYAPDWVADKTFPYFKQLVATYK